MFYSFLIIVGSVLSLGVLLKEWPESGKPAARLFESIFVLSLFGLCLIIWMYDLFPG